MKILMTGATGFIGTNLLPLLVHQEHTVGILKRSSSGLNSLASLSNHISVFDSDSYEKIFSAMREFSPDLVIHLATHYVNKHQPHEVCRLIDSNILLGAHVLEAMYQNAIPNLLNIGTRWQHLNNARCDSANLYAATKESFTVLIEYYKKLGIQYKTLELCDTFGMNDPRKKIVDLITDACKAHSILDLSPGEQILDLVYIDDLCAYIAKRICDNDFFDCSTISISGSEIRLRDLGSLIEHIYGVTGYLNWGGKKYREGEVMVPPKYYPCEQISSISITDALKKIKQTTDVQNDSSGKV